MSGKCPPLMMNGYGKMGHLFGECLLMFDGDRAYPIVALSEEPRPAAPVGLFENPI